MRSGILTKRVELWKKTTTQNGFGGLSEIWTKYASLRAFISARSGIQTIVNDESFDLIRLIIKVRNQYSIKEMDRIKYNDNLYQIDFIQPDVSDRWLTINCTRINE